MIISAYTSQPFRLRNRSIRQYENTGQKPGRTGETQGSAPFPRTAAEVTKSVPNALRPFHIVNRKFPIRPANIVFLIAFTIRSRSDFLQTLSFLPFFVFADASNFFSALFLFPLRRTTRSLPHRKKGKAPKTTPGSSGEKIKTASKHSASFIITSGRERNRLFRRTANPLSWNII